MSNYCLIQRRPAPRAYQLHSFRQTNSHFIPGAASAGRNHFRPSAWLAQFAALDPAIRPKTVPLVKPLPPG